MKEWRTTDSFMNLCLGFHTGGEIRPVQFLGKILKVPMWVSSMTGGTAQARNINTNLARACREFGMGMGLGSCRILLQNDEHLPDFDMRNVIGDELPFYANIGIVQLGEHVDRSLLSGIGKHGPPIKGWWIDHSCESHPGMAPDGRGMFSNFHPSKPLKNFSHLPSWKIIG